MYDDNDRQRILEELDILANAKGGVNFESGIMTGWIKGGSVKVSVETELDFIEGHLGNFWLLAKVIKEFRHKRFDIKFNKNPLAIVVSKNSTKTSLFLSELNLPYLNSLYQEDVVWQQCPSEIFQVIHEVLCSCSGTSNGYWRSMNLLHGAGRYLGITDDQIIIRHRLSKNLSFEFMLEPSDLKTILPKIRKMKVFGIARCNGGVMFDCGKVRIRLPEYVVSEPKEQIHTQINARDVALSVYYCNNMMPIINSIFSTPCNWLVKMPADIGSILRPFRLSKTITLTLDGCRLMLASNDERVGINKQVIDVKPFGNSNISTGITTETAIFLNAVKAGCLLGIINDGDNKRLLYVKNDNCEQILNGG